MLAEGTELAPAFLDYLRLDNRRARDLMVTPVITAPATTPASAKSPTCWRATASSGCRSSQDGKLVGIVSRADVVRVLAERPDALAAPA